MPCTLCQSPKHRASHCPDLCDVLRDGFYTGGGGGGGGHDHDEDDGAAATAAAAPPPLPLKLLARIQNNEAA